MAWNIPTKVCVLLAAVAIARTKFPPIQSEHEDSGDRGQISELAHYPHLWLPVIAQFFYMGAQVSTWSACILYMEQYAGVQERTAALFLTGHLIALTPGDELSPRG